MEKACESYSETYTALCCMKREEHGGWFDSTHWPSFFSFTAAFIILLCFLKYMCVYIYYFLCFYFLLLMKNNTISLLCFCARGGNIMTVLSLDFHLEFMFSFRFCSLSGVSLQGFGFILLFSKEHFILYCMTLRWVTSSHLERSCYAPPLTHCFFFFTKVSTKGTHRSLLLLSQIPCLMYSSI